MPNLSLSKKIIGKIVEMFELNKKKFSVTILHIPIDNKDILLVKGHARQPSI
jgi:hypothetical protein